MILIVWIAFVSFALFDFIFINKKLSWDSLPMGIEALIIIIFSVYYLFTQIKGSNNLSIYSTFNFWVATTFLFYFSGIFFLHIMTETMRENENFQQLYFIINNSFNILKNILLAVAMCMKTNSVFNSQHQVTDLDEDAFFNKPTNL